MNARFTIGDAARLAGLSLETTNEAARILKLKLLDGGIGPARLTFGSVRTLRDLAPALKTGVAPERAYNEFNQIAAEQMTDRAPCPVRPLRPSVPDPDAARRFYDQAVELCAGPAPIQYQRQLNLKTAEQLLRRAVALDPSLGEAWNDLAVVLWMRGAQRATVVALHRRALDVDPDLVSALYAVGMIEFQDGRPAEAEVLVRRACRIAPMEPRFFGLLAEIYTDLGRTKEATAARDKVRQIDESRQGMVGRG